MEVSTRATVSKPPGGAPSSPKSADWSACDRGSPISISKGILLDIDIKIEGYRNRKEYCHVERSDYCSERAKFLQATAQSFSSIYASESYLHEGYDARAKDNLAFECAFLQSGRLAGE
jgi:hypothetical protein